MRGAAQANISGSAHDAAEGGARRFQSRSSIPGPTRPYEVAPCADVDRTPAALSGVRCQAARPERATDDDERPRTRRSHFIAREVIVIARPHTPYTEPSVRPSRWRSMRCALGAAAGRALRRVSETFRRAPPTMDHGGLDAIPRSEPDVRVTSGPRQFIVYANRPGGEAGSVTAIDVRSAAPKLSPARHRRSTAPQLPWSPRRRRSPSDRWGEQSSWR
jgi:hypothetical protein